MHISIRSSVAVYIYRLSSVQIFLALVSLPVKGKLAETFTLAITDMYMQPPFLYQLIILSTGINYSEGFDYIYISTTLPQPYVLDFFSCSC